jgi:hypothetical protein
MTVATSVNTHPPFAPRFMLHALAKNWWLILLRGICAILFGVLTFIWPGVTLLTLILLYGAFAWQQDRKASGDFIDLRAEMDALVAISNCPHPFQAIGLEASRSILLVRHQGLTYGVSDPCNNVGAEVVRAFARTNRLCK